MSARREAVNRNALPEPRESLGELLGELMTESIELVKGEVALAISELREKARLYSSAALIMAVGIAFGLLAAMALLAAGIIALGTYTGLAASALIFGAALGALATLLFKYGLRNFKRHSPFSLLYSIPGKPTLPPGGIGGTPGPGGLPGNIVSIDEVR